jgi:DNA ligase (NAD+)
MACFFLIEKINSMSSGEYRKFLSETSPETLMDIKNKLKDVYYNTEFSSISDERYDELEEYIDYLETEVVVGASPNEDAIQLPIWLGSLDKIKYDEQEKLTRWIEKNKHVENVVVTPKFDGLSCLVERKKGVIKLYTRGNGMYGKDITPMLQYLSLKDVLGNFHHDFLMRGELIIDNNLFQKHSKSSTDIDLSGQKKYKNARQLVAGVVNCKTLEKRKDIAKDIEFVSYEFGFVDSPSDKQSFQLNNIMKPLDFNIPAFIIIKTKELTVEKLKEILEEMRKKSRFYLDGIVVTSDCEYTRNTKDNPNYSFAFKLQGECIDSIVEKVVWNASKWGLLKPIVYIQPIDLSGITITKTSGFNAKYILKNNIGPGACVKMTRSGDVIPYIVEVVKQAEKADMPKKKYKWNETEVDIIALDNDDDINIAQLTSFFQKIEAKHVSKKTIEKIYNQGYTSLETILAASEKDFQSIERIGERSSQIIYESMHGKLFELVNKIPKDLNSKQKSFVSLANLLAASGKFGQSIGERKLTSLFEGFPELVGKNAKGVFKPYELFFTLKESNEELREKILSIKGFSDKTTDMILDGLEEAKVFLDFIKSFYKEETEEPEHDNEISFTSISSSIDKDNKLLNLSVVFSGIRDKKLEEDILKHGGSVKTSVTGNTDILVVKDKEENSSKIKKARELGKKIMYIDEFCSEYIH